MVQAGVPSPRGERGFTLIELMVVVTIVSLAAAIAVPLYADAVRRTRTSSFAADNIQLYTAMMSYHADHGAFPSEDAFDIGTLSPLSELGYFPAAGNFTARLLDGRLLVYLAPDINGKDQQFLAVSRLAHDPRVVTAVAHTNILDGSDTWADGVFIVSDQAWISADNWAAAPDTDEH